jgi:hypothetical protein
VCGSSSLLVQVTVLPTGTVSVAGLNAKLSMLTALPDTGADGPAVAAPVPAGMFGIGAIPLIPGIPGVAAAEPKVTDGVVVAVWCDEHPATNISPTNAARAPHGRAGIAIHLHLRRKVHVAKR